MERKTEKQKSQKQTCSNAKFVYNIVDYDKRRIQANLFFLIRLFLNTKSRTSHILRFLSKIFQFESSPIVLNF